MEFPPESLLLWIAGKSNKHAWQKSNFLINGIKKRYPCGKRGL